VEKAKAKAKKPELSNWYKDRYQAMLVQRKVLVAVTFAALACTLCSVLVIVRMIPQKTIAPYVIQVDQKTGITQVIDPVTTQQLTANEAITNYFIAQYIRAREGYAANEIMRFFETVRLMSDPRNVFPAYRVEIDSNNPDSHPTRFGALGTRQVKFKSTTMLEPSVAQVRLLIEEKKEGTETTAQYHRIITLRFEYSKIPLSADERTVNPLGFRVTEYRVDEDVIQ
jgi:type IV secretion system protein VirB8